MLMPSKHKRNSIQGLALTYAGHCTGTRKTTAILLHDDVRFNKMLLCNQRLFFLFLYGIRLFQSLIKNATLKKKIIRNVELATIKTKKR